MTQIIQFFKTLQAFGQVILQ